MKEVYVKPQLHIEQFVLTQSIASCGAVAGGNSLGRPNHWSKTDCGWVVGDEVYWSVLPGCDDGTGEAYPDGWDGLGAVCYNNPSGGNSIFSS